MQTLRVLEKEKPTFLAFRKHQASKDKTNLTF